MRWVYAVSHTLARGFAAASVTMFFNGKAEALGMKFEGTQATELSIALLCVAIAIAEIEAITQDKK